MTIFCLFRKKCGVAYNYFHSEVWKRGINNYFNALIQNKGEYGRVYG